MDERTIKAARRVEEITVFYVHAAVYVIINLLLVIINVTITDDVWWAHWVILGWGLGLVAHWASVFGGTPRFIRRWQWRKLRELRRKA
ncbi:MAG: 2TM domain-containing protein [Hyphomicrobiaceae bacterium]|nr:2TM domain-containing protein [Hyphomicrobiaceae bacterium]